eukprot:gene8487-11507_t
MVIDAAKGIEARTLKLIEVCRLRDIPIITFINKMDRESRDTFDLLDEIEKTLALTYMGLAQASYDFTIKYLRGEVPGMPPVKRRMYPTKQIAVAQMQIKLEQIKGIWFQAITEACANPTKEQVLRAYAAQYTVMEGANELAALAIRTCGGLTRPGERDRLIVKFAEIDWTFCLILCLIAGAGGMMMFSAAPNSWEPWAAPHLIRFGIAFIVMIVLAMVDLRLWFTLAYPIYAVALFLLVCVEFFGDAAMGAQRWLEIGPLRFQPSEIMKIGIVLALARFYHGVSADSARFLGPRSLTMAARPAQTGAGAIPKVGVADLAATAART